MGEVPSATSDPSQRPVAAVHVGIILTSRLLQGKGVVQDISWTGRVKEREMKKVEASPSLVLDQSGMGEAGRTCSHTPTLRREG